MRMASIVMIPLLLLFLAIWAGLIYLLILLIRALRKYLRGGEARRERAETRRTLGEVLKAHRMRCQMTQEFVAEALGVSRQAVSKWETGTADPSTSNLLALAKLFGVPAEELLRAGRRRERAKGENRARLVRGGLCASLFHGPKVAGDEFDGVLMARFTAK